MQHARQYDSDDISNLSHNETFTSVLHRYLSRRTLLQGGTVGLALAYADTLLLGTGRAATAVSWLTTPDNVAFDAAGRMWIATDGQPEAIGVHDGLYMVETEGPERGRTRMFLSGPVGCEICGPAFTPDSRTLFVAISTLAEGRIRPLHGLPAAGPIGRPTCHHGPASSLSIARMAAPSAASGNHRGPEVYGAYRLT